LLSALDKTFVVSTCVSCCARTHSKRSAYSASTDDEDNDEEDDEEEEEEEANKGAVAMVRHK
jgi:ribosomal protein L12E/L44/L45/RPP1/RPP2